MPSSDACLLLDKSEGLTSAALVARVKRHLALAKVGHAGTLDRFASGLMLLFCGRATRLCPLFIGLDKRYSARVVLGAETSTLDPEGDVVAGGPLPSEEQVREVLLQLQQQQQQLPPDFSALHVGGIRAYQLALQGRETGLKPRPVRLYSVQVQEWAGAELELDLHCSSGYYVRAMVRDLGRACGSFAHLKALRRKAIGPMSLAEAVGLEQLEPGLALSPLSLLSRLSLPLLEVQPAWLKLLRDGLLPPLPEQIPEGDYLLHQGGERLLAVLQRQGGNWSYRVNFYPGV